MYQRNFLFGKDSGTTNAADVSARDLCPPCGVIDVSDRDLCQSCGAIGVSAQDLYRPGKGYGFIIEKNGREQELLKILELHSGFDTVYWYQDENISRLQEDGRGCFLDSDGIVAELKDASGEVRRGEHRRLPLSFCVDVPRRGNYKVTITIRTAEPLKDAMIFTGRRRLAYRGDIPGNTMFLRKSTATA